jgi:dTDP-glucose 4,6-dehydratase
MKTIMVTGGAGFIGSNFVRYLLAHRATKVINLDLLTYAGNLESLADVSNEPNHVFVRGSINDRDLVAGLLQQYQPDAIVHLAAESHVDRSIDSPAGFIETNIVGTFELLEATRHYWRKLTPEQRRQFRFLQVSTDEVYGSLGGEGLFTEETPFAPNSPYSASKAAADHLTRAYHHTYGLPVLTSNCSNNYGQNQFPEKLIPHMILSALADEPLPIYGDGRNIRDWLYVEDHCAALATIMEKGTPGEVYNIGGNSEKTNLEVVYTICRLLDEQAPRPDGQSYTRQIVFVTDRPGHDRRYAIDAAKLRTQLGWVPAETFASGILKTVKWYLDNREWCRRVADGSYCGQRLGIPDGEGKQ